MEEPFVSFYSLRPLKREKNENERVASLDSVFNIALSSLPLSTSSFSIHNIPQNCFCGTRRPREMAKQP